jgi:mono/diheme cytochrome c family protein
MSLGFQDLRSFQDLRTVNSCRAIVVTLVLMGMWVSTVAAAPNSRQAARIRLMNRKLDAVQKSLDKAFDIDKLAEEVDGLQSDYHTLLKEGSKDEKFLKLLEPAHKNLADIHAVLALEGVKVRMLLKPTMEAANAPMGISFTKDVAPIFVAKCGRCHVTGTRGGFNMGNYAALIEGSDAGKVIFPGEKDGPLIENIEAGDMPPGAGKVTDEELAKIKKWVLDGAKFDGPNPTAPLPTYVTVDPSMAPPERLEVKRATGKETVSFVNEVAPIFAERCAGCHGNGQRPGGRFDLATFDRMLRGGDSGLALLPEKPEESLILSRITAEGRERMPRGGEPLTTEQIEKITTWIKEGATFDGEDTGRNVVMVAAIAKARRSTHEELSAEREELAETNWRRAMPGVTSDEVATKNFLVVGNVGTVTLNEYAKRAEALALSVSKSLKVPTGKPLVKGKTTLYILNTRYDYTEFGRMIEQRTEVPRSWRGHWNFTVVDSYGAIVPAREEEYSNDVLMAQQIAGTYVASLPGRPPRWFSEGAARAIAAQVQREDDSLIQGWNESVAAALGTSRKSNDFMTGRIDNELANSAAYSYVSFLMKADAKRFSTLLRGLNSGVAFDRAFTQVYGMTPVQMADTWARAVQSQK